MKFAVKGKQMSVLYHLVFVRITLQIYLSFGAGDLNKYIERGFIVHSC